MDTDSASRYFLIGCVAFYQKEMVDRLFTSSIVSHCQVGSLRQGNGKVIGSCCQSTAGSAGLRQGVTDSPQVFLSELMGAER